MTILFAEDWLKVPNAIIDLETSNRSFIRQASLYKEMGIKNNAFILALHDRNLQGVNPHDPNLTRDMMARVTIECKVNFWYFIREVIKAPSRSSLEPPPFLANRGNIALYWSFFNACMVNLIQPRQTGKSVSSDVLDVHLVGVRCVKTDINLLTKSDELRAENLKRIKDLYDTLPSYMKCRTNRDIGNTEMFTVKELGNKYQAYVPNKSPKLAALVGRGMTSAINKIDEIAYIPNLRVTYQAMMSSGIAARRIAAENDEPRGIITTTTAGKLDDADGKEAYKIITDSARWTEKF